jgi:hypothetical protein
MDYLLIAQLLFQSAANGLEVLPAGNDVLNYSGEIRRNKINSADEYHGHRHKNDFALDSFLYLLQRVCPAA